MRLRCVWERALRAKLSQGSRRQAGSNIGTQQWHQRSTQLALQCHVAALNTLYLNRWWCS